MHHYYYLNEKEGVPLLEHVEALNEALKSKIWKDCHIINTADTNMRVEAEKART